MKIELYIDKQLCDISDPDKFSVYLKRRLYNPTELNTKDAQVSYSITLPATTTNNRIFGFTNVEEVRGKFTRLYDAELIVNGIRILDGKFRLNEITADAYKGNLGIPAPVTVKEIFKDKNMNRLEEWIVNIDADNSGLDFISKMNKKETPECIFPFVLYSLMPRDANIPPMYDGANGTPDFEKMYRNMYKQIYDEDVRLGIQDIPASVNCLQMLEHIFEKAGYGLTGSAFSDERLKNLYVSYKNPNDYPQGWNWGDLAEMKIEGSWKSVIKDSEELYERQITTNSDDYGKYFNINLFDSNHVVFSDIKDNGTNITYTDYKDKYDNEKYRRKKLNVIIPKSGYYKVHLKCNIELDHSEYDMRDRETDYIFVGAKQGLGLNNDFRRSRYEVQLMRDYAEGDFNNVNLVGLFNNPQFSQTHYEDKTQYPKFYPHPNGAMVIDPAINQNFICGLRWGASYDNREWNALDKVYNNKGNSSSIGIFNNYKWVDASPNYMFIANGFSRDITFSQKTKILSAYDSCAYVADQDPDTDIYTRKDHNYYRWSLYDYEEVENENGETEEKKIEPKYEMRDVNVRRGQFSDYPEKVSDSPEKYKPYNYVKNDDPVKDLLVKGEGRVECIIWLEKGERLALCLAGDLADKNKDNGNHWNECIQKFENVEFALHIEPFNSEIEWNNFDSQGNYNQYENLYWDPANDKNANKENPLGPGFRKGHINLTDFLPSNVKADSWIDNFCKAFNLALVNAGENKFELNLKQTDIPSGTHRLIDIDNRAHISRHSNQDLSLPRLYKLGFEINSDEEGYYRSEKEHKEDNSKPIETGGGEFYTGSIDTNTVEQTSNFSYCWYKELYEVDKNIPRKFEKEDIKFLIKVPVITDHEIWDGKSDYKEMASKLYFDKAQRFWFKTGTHRFPFGMKTINTDVESLDEDELLPRKYADIAVVDNKLGEPGELILSYENEPNTLLKKYFFLLDNNSHYTEIECYLTPEEYEKINLSLVKFNGDLYNVASVDGYDPMCRKPAKLLLIPKIK